jgi:hypothetical protein
LKKMSQLGMTSIMVIHQPRYSLFTLFDDVLLLGKGGKTVYLGPSLCAKAYFEMLGFTMEGDENPADWFMDVISGEVPNKRIKNFEPSMLFEWWEQNKDFTKTFVAPGVRPWTADDDRMALTRKLDEEWCKVDTDGNDMLDIDELQELLTLCKGTEPDMEAVRELMDRMAGRHSDEVTKHEFLDYLCSLQSVVAEDRISEVSSESSGDEDTENEYDLELCSCRILRRTASSSQLPGLQRDQPGFCRQLRIICIRRLVQWWRNSQQRAIFLGVIVFAAVVLATMDEVLCDEPDWAAEPYLNLHTCLALLTSVYCLGVFSGDRPVFWRESASGVNVLAFYIARALTNTFDLLLQCYLFAAIYYLLRQPDMDFIYYFIPFLLVSFVSSGVGYVISTTLPPQHGPFIAALVSFVSCGLLGHPLRVDKLLDAGVLEAGMDFLSITRWSVGMSFLKYVEKTDVTGLSPAARAEISGLEKIYQTQPMWQEKGYWDTSIMFLCGMGCVLYVAGYLGLKFTNCDKQV